MFGVLYACLFFVVLATALGLLGPLRGVFAVPGLLLAPGYTYLSFLRIRGLLFIDAWTLVGLSIILSLSFIVLGGIFLGVVRLPVTEFTLGVFALLLSLPPFILVYAATSWQRRPALLTQGRQLLLRSLPALAASGVFAFVLLLGASWHRDVSTGPFTELRYAGHPASVAGPVSAGAGGILEIPLIVKRSDSQPWVGRIVVRIDDRPHAVRVVRRMDATVGEVISMRLNVPTSPGFYNVRVEAMEESSSRSSELTLRINVSAQ